MNTLFKKIIIILFLLSSHAYAESDQALVLFYDEYESSAGKQFMRYLINDDYLRIDGGKEDSDFILFERKKNMIFSVNHEDQTILKIKYNKWKQPEFDFQVNVSEKLDKNAPDIFGEKVHQYEVKVGKDTCTNVFLLEGMYPEKMQVLYEYQKILSGQQVATLQNTPKEMHTPCFLVDQVFHNGDYYKKGLPIQITYSRDYSKILKDIKEQKVENRLFELPAAYSEYFPFTQ